eukprot:GFUD01013200.1.p1 GENE.GFUD01013200.1~~GFUD01013200.1.p1  ORF type:complete len:272 (+),score=109.55 GFUD01013200.1:55-870(+)
MEISQEELVFQEQMMDPQELAKRKDKAAAIMRQSLQKWNSEREKNEEYIEQMRQNKEKRKQEIEADQALLLSMKEDDEAEAARAEEEKLKYDDIDVDQKEGQQEKTKQNFADQKKFKTEEEREYQEALTRLIKPFDIKSMDSDQLKKKVAELYDIFTNIINDTINLNKRLIEQHGTLKDQQEKLDMILDAKAAKKSGIDMQKFYPGKNSHPAKLTIFSKYDNKKGTRTYDDRKDMYDMGTDVVRPQMLVSVWEEKFNAWMNSAPADESDEE